MTLPDNHPIMRLLEHYEGPGRPQTDGGGRYHTAACPALGGGACACPWGAVRDWIERGGGRPMVTVHFAHIPEAFKRSEGYQAAEHDEIDLSEATFAETVLTPDDDYPATLDAETLSAWVLRPEFTHLEIIP